MNFNHSDLLDLKDCIEEYITKRYGLKVILKTPNDLKIRGEINVDKWQLSVETSPEQKHLPRQRIKMEVINIPSYSREPQALVKNYDFFPDGYSDLLVMTQSLDEIMTDKIVSLVNCRRYVRMRDIWDLRWLEQQGASFNLNWLNNKIQDYNIVNYPLLLEQRVIELSDIIHGKDFKNEMTRFIPSDIQERTLKKDMFYDFLTSELLKLFKKVKQALAGESEQPFQM